MAPRSLRKTFLDCGKFTSPPGRGRIYSCKFSNVNTLRKGKSGTFSLDETCLKFSQVDRNMKAVLVIFVFLNQKRQTQISSTWLPRNSIVCGWGEDLPLIRVLEESQMFNTTEDIWGRASIFSHTRHHGHGHCPRSHGHSLQGSELYSFLDLCHLRILH